MLNLDPACRGQLLTRVAHALPHVTYSNGRFLDFRSLDALHGASEALPRAIKRSIEAWISDYPVEDFVRGFLGEELQAISPYERQPESRLLISRPEFQDPEAVAERCVAALESLPRDYRIVVKLPLLVSEATTRAIGSRFAISRHLTLLPGTEVDYELAEAGADQGALGMAMTVALGLGTLGPVAWDEGSYYVESQVEGCVFDGLSTNTSGMTVRNLRAFAGVGKACGLFDLGSGYLPLYGLESRMFVYEEASPDTMLLKEPQAIKARHAQDLDNLRWSEYWEGLPDDKATEFLGAWLGAFRAMFRERHECAPLQLASQWYFESFSSDELLSFVQVIVALEILLGDKKTADKVGVVQLLANRCAYLLGRTSTERRELLQQFEEIYQTRSEIIHRGKNQLTADERDHLYRARRLCEQVITKELLLVLGESRSTAR